MDASVVAVVVGALAVGFGFRVDRRREVARITVVDVTIAVEGNTEVKVRILVDARAVRVSVTVLVMTTVASTICVAEMIFVKVSTTTVAGSGVDASEGMGISTSPHSPRPSWHPSPQWSTEDPQYPWAEQQRPNRDPAQETVPPQVPSVLLETGGDEAVPDLQ